MYYLYFFVAQFFIIGLCQAIAPEKKFNLITTLYNEKNSDRVDEFIQCIENNLAHELINEIFVFYDNAQDDQENKLFNYLKSKPIVIHCMQGRATYEICIDIANKLYPQSKVIICNADIYFNETFHRLENYDLTNTFLAITRWNVKADHSLVMESHPFSQDAWIFQTPIALKKSNFEMGTWACDCSIAYWARKSGLRVLNPSLTIQPCHLHLSNLRNWEYKARHSIKQMIGIIPTTLEASSTEYPSLYQALKKDDPLFLVKLKQDLSDVRQQKKDNVSKEKNEDI